MSEAPAKRKRGRPRKSVTKPTSFSTCSEIVKWVIDEQDTALQTQEKARSKERHIELYRELYEEFSSHGISQQTQVLLRKLASSHSLPDNINSKALLRLLTRNTKELMLNELEVVVWALYLDNLQWNCSDESLEELLLYSAFASKQYLNSDVDYIASYINQKRPQFAEHYEVWSSARKDAFNVKPKVLNKRFRELNKPIPLKENTDNLDYNIYVDEILFAPGKQSRPCPSSVLYEDEEIISLYKSYKASSRLVLSSSQDEEALQTALERLDSIISQLPDAEDIVSQAKEGVVHVGPEVIKRVNSLCSEFL